MTQSKHTLERNAVDPLSVIFQSVASMGPAVGIAYAIVVGAPFAGGSLTGSVVLALIACLLIAIPIGQIAKHLPSAGGLSTYVANGLNPFVGFLAAWASVFAYFTFIPFLALLIGFLLAGTFADSLHVSYDLVWIVGSLLGIVVVFVINYLGIRFNTRVGVLLGLLEMVVFIVLSLTLIMQAGPVNKLGLFNGQYSTVPGFVGPAGIIGGSVYAILAFVGFEAAAPLGEEAQNPRRAITIAIVGSTLVVGLFYVFTNYAATVYFGPTKFANFSTYNNGNPWVGMAQSVWGAGWIVVLLTLLNSAIANINGGANACTRMAWALARIGILPAILQRTHPRLHSPYIATIAAFSAGTIVTLGLGKLFGPTTAYGLIGTIMVTLLIPVYAATNLACMVYYWRQRRSEFNWLWHGIIPVAGILILVPAFFATLGITAFSFISPLTYPLNLAGPIVIIWLVLGLAFGIYLRSRHPERIEATAHVFEEATPEQEPVPVTF